MAAYQVLLLNTAIPQIQAAQSGDTYVVPRDIAFSTVASLAAGTEALPSLVATGDVNTGFWFPAADTIAASTGGTRRLTVDSSGNLGLGVTPNANWNTFNRIFQVGAGSLINYNDENNTILGSNVYYGGSPSDFRYITASQTASMYRLNAGAHTWHTTGATTGLANGVAALTQAMTLDASGNLGIGTTSPLTKVQASGEILASNASFGISTQLIGARLTGEFSGATAGIDMRRWTGAGTDHGTAAMVTDASANIIWYSDFRSSNIPASTERARITSGGNLLVGTTSNSAIGSVKALFSSSADVSIFETSNTNAYPIYAFNSATTGDNKFINFNTEAAGTSRGSITYNRAGGLVAYNTTSDYRAKDILGPVTDTGATIDALKVYNGKMKGATVERPMLIAHEAQTVTPYAVTGEKDAVDEDGKPKYQQMDVSSLVPLLIAEIQSLRARVAQLEQGA